MVSWYKSEVSRSRLLAIETSPEEIEGLDDRLSQT